MNTIFFTASDINKQGRRSPDLSNRFTCRTLTAAILGLTMATVVVPAGAQNVRVSYDQHDMARGAKDAHLSSNQVANWATEQIKSNANWLWSKAQEVTISSAAGFLTGAAVSLARRQAIQSVASIAEARAGFVGPLGTGLFVVGADYVAGRSGIPASAANYLSTWTPQPEDFTRSMGTGSTVTNAGILVYDGVKAAFGAKNQFNAREHTGTLERLLDTKNDRQTLLSKLQALFPMQLADLKGRDAQAKNLDTYWTRVSEVLSLMTATELEAFGRDVGAALAKAKHKHSVEAIVAAFAPVVEAAPSLSREGSRVLPLTNPMVLSPVNAALNYFFPADTSGDTQYEPEPVFTSANSSDLPNRNPQLRPVVETNASSVNGLSPNITPSLMPLPGSIAFAPVAVSSDRVAPAAVSPEAKTAAASLVEYFLGAVDSVQATVGPALKVAETQNVVTKDQLANTTALNRERIVQQWLPLNELSQHTPMSEFPVLEAVPAKPHATRHEARPSNQSTNLTLVTLARPLTPARQTPQEEPHVVEMMELGNAYDAQHEVLVNSPVAGAVGNVGGPFTPAHKVVNSISDFLVVDEKSADTMLTPVLTASGEQAEPTRVFVATEDRAMEIKPTSLAVAAEDESEEAKRASVLVAAEDKPVELKRTTAFVEGEEASADVQPNSVLVPTEDKREEPDPSIGLVAVRDNSDQANPIAAPIEATDVPVEMKAEAHSSEEQGVDGSHLEPPQSAAAETLQPPTIQDVNVAPVQAALQPAAGTYNSNAWAANTMFQLTLNDRLNSYYDGESGPHQGRAWIRYTGSRSELKDSTGQLLTQSDKNAVMMGADMFSQGLNANGQFTVGIMGGYGHYSGDTRSDRYGHSATGKVDGYSFGMYGTYQQDAAAQQGLYADSWMLWNQFDNRVKGSEMQAEKYKSKGVTASVELGYNINVAERDNVKYLVQPHTQVIYQSVRAEDFRQADGTRVDFLNGSRLQTAVGVRASAQIATGMTTTITPHIEANWLHSAKGYGVRLDGVGTQMNSGRNAGQLKLGVQGKLTGNVSLNFELFHNQGTDRYHETGGNLSAQYRY